MFRIIISILIITAAFSSLTAKDVLKINQPFPVYNVNNIVGEKVLYKSLVRANTENGNEVVIASLLYWKSKGNQLIPLNDLAALSEFMHDILQRFDKSKQLEKANALLQIIQAYYQHNELSFTSEEQLTVFKELLRQRTCGSINADLEQRLAPSEFFIKENKWNYLHTAITPQGGLVKRSLNGEFVPFGISEEETILLAPPGTVPEIGFVLGVESMDGAKREQFMKNIKSQREGLRIIWRDDASEKLDPKNDNPWDAPRDWEASKPGLSKSQKP